jgi:hypothetical protein
MQNLLPIWLSGILMCFVFPGSFSMAQPSEKGEYVDREVVRKYRSMMLPFLYKKVQSGYFPVYVVDGSDQSTIQAAIPTENLKSGSKFDPDSLTANLRNLKNHSNKEPYFDFSSQIGEDASALLWNYFVDLGYFSRSNFRFVVDDDVLPGVAHSNNHNSNSDNNGVSNVRVKGQIERIAPLLAGIAKFDRQLFRERVRFKVPGDKIYNFLTIRLTDFTPDGVWLNSPFFSSHLRRLFSANRDNAVLGLALNLNDFLGYSANISQSTSVIGSRKKLLSPEINHSTVNLTIDKDCYRFTSERIARTRTLPHLSHISAAFYSDIVFRPRILQRVDVMYKDFTSWKLREELWFDTNLSAPVFRVVYDHEGIRRHWVVNVFEVVKVEDKKITVPRMSFVGDERTKRLSLVRYTKGQYCHQSPLVIVHPAG